MPGQIRQTLGLDLRPERIRIYLLHDRTAYKEYLRRYFPTVPYRRALFIQMGGQRMVFLQRGPELPIDLRHEATHALLQSVAKLPLWLDEGLAVYFETSDREATTERRAAAFGQLLRRGAARSLDDLEKLHDLSQMHAEEYQAAWAWVHFALHGPAETQDAWRAYVAILSKQAVGPPLGQRLRDALPALDRTFSDHFTTLSPTSDSPTISARLDAELQPK